MRYLGRGDAGWTWGYPAPRPRDAGANPTPGLLYGRTQSMAAELATTDAMVEAITFSGRVDAVRLAARTAGARFQLTDRTHREGDFLAVLAGESVLVPVACEVVLVQSLVAATPASVHVAGLWAAPTGASNPAAAAAS